MKEKIIEEMKHDGIELFNFIYESLTSFFYLRLVINQSLLSNAIIINIVFLVVDLILPMRVFNWVECLVSLIIYLLIYFYLFILKKEKK